MTEYYCMQCDAIHVATQTDGWLFHWRVRHHRCGNCGCAVGETAMAHLRMLANRYPSAAREVARFERASQAFIRRVLRIDG